MKENSADAGKSITDRLPAVELMLADGSVYDQKGKIETISGSVDSQTGTIRFRATFPNPQGILRNGSKLEVDRAVLVKDHAAGRCR